MIANNQGDKEAAIKGFSGCLTALKPQLLKAFWSGEDPARLEHIKRLAAEGLAQLAPDILAEHEPKKQGQCMDQKAAEQRAKEEAVVEVVQKVTSTDGSTREKHLAKLHKRLKADSSESINSHTDSTLLNCRGLAKPGMLSFLPPLHLAVFHNDTELCKILLEHGADPGYGCSTLLILYYTHTLPYSTILILYSYSTILYLYSYSYSTLYSTHILLSTLHSSGTLTRRYFRQRCSSR
jgi:hypothetical protein